MWDTLKLKLEETSFFAGQLAGFTRHPKVFLFHLSAFLTSARSVTFHLQKQLSTSGKKQYEALRDAILADEEAGYFVQARNRAEKQGYPAVAVAQLVAYEDEGGKLVWTQYANTILPGATGWSLLEQLQKHDWDERSIASPPSKIEYVWTFPDFPGGEKEVATACREFSDRLWHFVFKFRSIWEQEHDREATLRRINEASDRFVSGWSDEEGHPT